MKNKKLLSLLIVGFLSVGIATISSVFSRKILCKSAYDGTISVRSLGRFSPEEDEQLKTHVLRQISLSRGVCWKLVAKQMGNVRTSASYRTRYTNHLIEVTKTEWTPEENESLMRKYNEVGPKWIEICVLFPESSPEMVKNQVKSILEIPFKNKTEFTTAEDEHLLNLVQRHGTSNWQLISRNMGTNRTARKCRERYYNYLNVEQPLQRNLWTPEEDDILLEKYKLFKGSFKQISQFMPNRTERSVRNRYDRIKNRFNIYEDIRLTFAILKYGKNWDKVAKDMPNRTADECEERSSELEEEDYIPDEEWYAGVK